MNDQKERQGSRFKRLIAARIANVTVDATGAKVVR